MHEKEKLDEAKYFYSQMMTNYNISEQFTYNLSAFLSCARSVLQYALEELKNNRGQAWYDEIVSASTILSFFKDKRDVNIHTEPVHPTQHLTITVPTLHLHLITFPPSVIVKDASGNMMNQTPIEALHPETKSQSAQEPAQTTVRYVFSDWSGPEDIMTLCQKYTDELEIFVNDGIERGFLT